MPKEEVYHPFLQLYLETAVVQSAVKQEQLKSEDIEESGMGYVLTAGLGQAPAR